MRLFKSVIKSSLFIVCTFSLTGCLGSIDKATQNALEACGIVKYVPPKDDSVVDENSPKKGEYVFNSNDSGGFWSVSDDFKSLEKRADGWKKNAIAASAASKLDDKYKVLATSTTNLSNITSQVVNIRREMLSINSNYYSGYDWSFTNTFNLDLNTYKIECTGIADSLNN